jgi:nucleosome assembly protein 1-like 1
VVKGKVDAPADIVLGEEAADADETGPAGVPEFWVGVLRANEVTAAQITEKDEEVLEYLVDIRSRELDGEDECGFEITFEFAENPFFENTTLVKTYHMVDSDDPVLEKATGTKIEWKSGKNVTVKVMKKKPKPGKGGKASKPITKTEPVASFFSFFSPPKVPEGDEELDEDDMEQLQAALEEDYEIGEVIRDQLIPNAVSWYTGEAGEDEDDEDEEDEDEDDDDDEEDDDDDEDSEEEDSDEDGAPKIKAAKAPTDAKEQPAECKQQ